MPVSRTRARSGSEVISRRVTRPRATWTAIRAAVRAGRYHTWDEGPLSMRRIGVMGGTFDPIHHGHLVAASEVAHIFGLDEVKFVPTGQPYEKDNRKVSPAEDRYLMTVIATASNPRFSVSRVDIDRPGPTYTIDTLNLGL